MIINPEASASESSALDIPVPPRDFGSTRRMLIAAFVASLFTPLFFLAAYGYFGYQTRISDSSEEIDRLTRVAEEQAVKVLDVTREMSLRVMAFLGEDGDTQFARGSCRYTISWQTPPGAYLPLLPSRFSRAREIFWQVVACTPSVFNRLATARSYRLHGSMMRPARTLFSRDKSLTLQ